MKTAALFLAVVLLCSQAGGLSLDLGGTLPGVLGSVVGLVGKILQLIISILENLLGSLNKPPPGIPFTPQPDSPIALVVTGLKALFYDASNDIKLATVDSSEIENIIRDALNGTNASEVITNDVTKILKSIFDSWADNVLKLNEAIIANLNALFSSLSQQLQKLIDTLTKLNDPALDQAITSLKVFIKALEGVFAALKSAAASVSISDIAKEALANVKQIVEKAVKDLTSETVEDVVAKLTKDLRALLNPAKALQILETFKETVIAALEKLNQALAGVLSALFNVPQIYNALK